MKRILLIAALAACDDPEVTDKVASVLEHGLVAAQFQCTGSATQTVSPFDHIGISLFRVQKLIDGSCFVSNSPWGGYPYLLARSDPGAETCRFESSPTAFAEVEGGVASFTTSTPPVIYEADIETECTGFNLEAFGVE